MPRGDGSGPMGMGPMTGRGAGICAGYATPGYANQAGYGCGLGGGRGFRRMFNVTGIPGWNRFGYFNSNTTYASTVDEKELLSRQAKILENQLAGVKKRLSNIDESAEG